MRRELLTKIDRYVVYLKSASRWGGSEKSLDSASKGSDNYIYEFYCYLRIVADLMSNYEVEFVKGNNSRPYSFPKAAALKANAPKFLIKDKEGNVEFQICAGTRIWNKYKEALHPDISFQTSEASDDPDFEDLVMIYDAKFKKNTNDSLPNDEIDSFAMHIKHFDLGGKNPPQIFFDKLRDILGNSVLTNGDTSGVNEQRLKDHNLKEVSRFRPDEQFVVKG